MRGGAGAVDGRVDVEASAVVVLAAGEEFEVLVRFGVVDDLLQLGEGGGVDDGSDEVLERVGRSDFQGLGRFHELCGEGVVQGRGDVHPRRGAAFLTGVLEGAADGLHDHVAEIGALVDQVEVLAAGLADDTGVASVGAFGDAFANLAVQRAENGGATGVVEAGKLGVGEDGRGDGLGVARDELNDVAGKPGFKQDVVKDVVGGDGGGRGFPDYDVAHKGRGAGEIATNGGEVEG